MPRPAQAYGEIDFESLAIALEKIKTMYGLPDTGASGEEGILQEPGATDRSRISR